jgi:hypothetical protein
MTGLATGFINNLQVLTAINCYIIALLHILQSFHINLFSLTVLVFIHLSHTNYNSLIELHTPNITQIKSSNHRLSLRWPTSNSSVLSFISLSSSPTNFLWHPLPRTDSSLNRMNSTTYIAKERIRITGNTCHVTTTHRCVTSPQTRKTQPPLLLRNGLFTNNLSSRELLYQHVA